MPQRMRADALGNLCRLRCFDDDAMQMPGADRLRRLLAWKQPALCVHHALLPSSLPPLVQQGQQIGREDDHRVLAHTSGDAYPAWLSQRFQPRRDIHAITQRIAILDHYVGVMQSDSQLRPAIASAQPLLEADRAAQRLHGGWKLGEQPVAGILEDPPAVLRNCGIDNLGTQRA
jgi:hypothetical protein